MPILACELQTYFLVVASFKGRKRCHIRFTCVAQKRRCLKINLSTTLLNRPQKIVLFINAGKYCVKITGDNPYNGPAQKGVPFSGFR